MLARSGIMPHGPGNKSADRTYLRVVEADAEGIIDVRNSHIAQDNDTVLDALYRLFFLLVVFVPDLSDNFLKYILHGHNAGYAAVLIRNHGHLNILFPELLNGVVQPHGVRDKVCGAQYCRELLFFDFCVDKVFDVYDTDYMIYVLFVHRHPRVAGFYHLVQCGVHGCVFLDSHRIDTGCHDFFYHRIAELEHGIDEFSFIGLYDTFLGALVYDGPYLLFGNYRQTAL